MNQERRILVVEDDLSAADAARRAASEEGNRRALAHLAGDIGTGEGQCGGYYHCPTCAAEIGRAKDAEAARFERSSRPPTREELAADRARLERRRAKAKAAKRARKLQRRRSR